jgi:hypothetical protein
MGRRTNSMHTVEVREVQRGLKFIFFAQMNASDLNMFVVAKKK